MTGELSIDNCNEFMKMRLFCITFHSGSTHLLHSYIRLLGGLSPSSLIAWLPLVAYLDPPPNIGISLKNKSYSGTILLPWQAKICPLGLDPIKCMPSPLLCYIMPILFCFVWLWSSHDAFCSAACVDGYLVFSAELNSIILNFKIFDINDF